VEARARRAGVYLLETFDQEDGSVSVQLRGPFRAGIWDGHEAPRLVARAVAPTEAAAKHLVELSLDRAG
jgi:hypothetical protein